MSPVGTMAMWIAGGTVSLSEHTADGGMTMMNDEEFRQFLKAFRAAYGLPPRASNVDTVDDEGPITEYDYVSQSPSQAGRWRQDD